MEGGNPTPLYMLIWPCCMLGISAPTESRNEIEAGVCVWIMLHFPAEFLGLVGKRDCTNDSPAGAAARTVRARRDNDIPVRH